MAKINAVKPWGECSQNLTYNEYTAYRAESLSQLLECRSGCGQCFLDLGDVIVPSTAILLSHHVSHFLHMTMAVLIPFLVAAAFSAFPGNPRIAHSVLGFLLALTLLNGALLVTGNYQGFLQQNREIVELSQLQRLLNPADRDLLIARSETVDDPCGWVVYMSQSPVLFCTDAEVMLTPQQNHYIHRFRQAVYLYLTGENSDLMQRALAGPSPSSMMWKLGYWAEAISPSAEERTQGIHAIQSDVVPWLERVQNHDVEVSRFFRNFRRIIVIDSRQDHTFTADRLAAFLNLEGQQNYDDFLVLFYVSKVVFASSKVVHWNSGISNRLPQHRERGRFRASSALARHGL